MNGRVEYQPVFNSTESFSLSVHQKKEATVCPSRLVVHTVCVCVFILKTSWLCVIVTQHLKECFDGRPQPACLGKHRAVLKGESGPRF